MGCGFSRASTSAATLVASRLPSRRSSRQSEPAPRKRAPPAPCASLALSAAAGPAAVLEALGALQLPEWKRTPPAELSQWLLAVHACLDALWSPALGRLEAAISDGGAAHGWQSLQADSFAQLLRRAAADAAPAMRSASAALLEVAAGVWHAAAGRKEPADAMFVNRSVVQLFSYFSVIMFRRVIVEDAQSLEHKADVWSELCTEFGLQRPHVCTVLDAGAKATLVYLDLVSNGDGQCRLNCGRHTALWDALPQWEASCASGPEGHSCKLFPRFFSHETGGWERGEGHGPRKELFALIGQQMLRGCEAEPAKMPPLLPYVPEARHHWFDHTATQRDDGVARLLRFAGWVAGQTLCNRATLQVQLPLLLFRKLLGGADFEADMAALVEFDPEAARSLQAVHKMSDADFAALVELEETPGVTRAQYVEAALRRLLVDSCSWQFDAFRRGFSQALPIGQLRAVLFTPAQLAAAVCGSVADCADEKEDFSLQQTFRVVMDEELQQCAPLRDALWAVLEGWAPAHKRKFIKFVTGSARLPAAGSEVLTVEMPFTAVRADEVAAMAGILPQAHTCDNILELPNYWAALCARHKVAPADCKPGKAHEKLLAELRQLLHRQLTTAVFECDAYGLDEGAVPSELDIPPNAASLPCSQSCSGQPCAGPLYYVSPPVAPARLTAPNLLSHDRRPSTGASRQPPTNGRTPSPPAVTPTRAARGAGVQHTEEHRRPLVASDIVEPWHCSPANSPRTQNTSSPTAAIARLDPHDMTDRTRLPCSPRLPPIKTSAASPGVGWDTSTSSEAPHACRLGRDSATEDVVEDLAPIGPESPDPVVRHVNTTIKATAQDHDRNYTSPRRNRVDEPDDLEHLEL